MNALVDAWVEVDPDSVTRRAIEQSRSDPDWAQAHFGSVMRFGTAGMRAAVGPGPARMNRVMARVAARAIGEEMLEQGLGERGAVVGFDARPDSADMAFDAARLLAAMGIGVAIIDGYAPTPLLARQLVARRSGAGLMFTASHNPREDNGLKLYWSDGVQIRPPLDRQIEARIERAIAAPRLPADADLAPRHELELLEVRAVIAEYVGAVVRPPVTGGARGPADPAHAAPRVAYTALCGVGAETIGHSFSAAGLPPPHYVEHQRRPDGSFPDLPFPNPEEPGTLDAAIAFADEVGTDLVLANDPDADRLAVAVRDAAGGWQRLSGDETALLLCDWLIDRVHEGTTSNGGLISASSVVSGTLVQALCEARGVAHFRMPTGFKWIMQPRLANPQARWVFGYEEALGYSVTDAVMDKDGISAAVEFVRLAAALAERGSSPLERLDELAAELGLHVTAASSLRADASAIAAAMTRLRTDPPAEIAGWSVGSITDWQSPDAPIQADLVELTLRPDGVQSSFPGDAPAVQQASRDLAVRACVRPSGTEPKVKIYLEAVDPPNAHTNLPDSADPASPQPLAQRRTELTTLLADLATAFRHWLAPTQ